MDNFFFKYLLEHLDKGNFKEILKKTSIKSNFLKYSKYPDFWDLRGIAFSKSGKPSEAIESFLKSFHVKKSHLSLYNIAKVFNDYGKLKKAYEYYLKSYQIDSNYEPTLTGLIDCSFKENNFEDCIKYLNEALVKSNKLKKEVIYNFLGVCFENQKDFINSIKYYKKSIEENINFFPANLNLANYYASTGEIDLAINIYEKIILDYPNSSETHRRLSVVKKYKSLNDAHLAQMLNLFSSSKDNEKIIEELGFAIAKAYEDLGDYEKSFYYFSQSNKIRDKKVNYDSKKENIICENISSIFKSELPEIKFKKTNSIPIFILGLPRSGSTLVEQIVSSHSRVEGLEEINAFHSSLNETLGDEKNKSIKDKFLKNTEAKIIQLRELYSQKVLKIKKTSLPYHTDKLPLNFKYIGFIKLAFPEAKIVLTSRDYRDVFVSILKNYFAQIQMSFAYNEKSLLLFIENYKKYIKFWYDLMKEFIYEINYEKLIKDPEGQIKELLNFCNLSLEQDCLNFYKNKKNVSTASINQVRQPIYKSSSKSFAKYENYLSSYFEKLLN